MIKLTQEQASAMANGKMAVTVVDPQTKAS